MSPGAVCGYSISGGYGPISRFLYYILLLITLVFHKTEWLVSSSLGASMIFSSIAAVHAVALASARGKGTVDFDIIPVYAITGVGMLIGTPLLVWSKTLREARTSTRFLAFTWIALMFVGAMASRASMVKLPTPLDCDDPTNSGCPLVCNVSLPMRQGQQIMTIPFRWSEFLDTWSFMYSWFSCSMTAMGLMFAHGRQHPMEQARAELRARGVSKRLRNKNAGRTVQCAFCSPPLAAGLTIAHLVLMEVIMLGPGGLPLGENETAIGQWGPLVGAAFALFASIIEWKFGRQKTVNVRSDIETGRTSARSRDQQAALAGLTPLPSSPTVSAVTQKKVAERYDVSAYFEEGKWWGIAANGLIMNHGGVKWVVPDGYLRRFVSGGDAEDRTAGGSGTFNINSEETSAKIGSTFSQPVGVIAKDTVTAEEAEFGLVGHESDNGRDLQVHSSEKGSGNSNTQA